MSRIILASGSPRRRQLLTQLGIRFEVIKATGEELTNRVLPREVVEELSLKKAKDVCGIFSQGEETQKPLKRIPEAAKEKTHGSGPPLSETVVVIGADTVVAFEGKVLGKPADEADALRILSLLQGNTHQVYTGVTLAVRTGDTASERQEESAWRFRTFHEMTAVTMYPAAEEELRAYIATGEPMDKAGAYGIQGRGAALVKEIHGDYNTVVGLPAGRLYREMKAGNLI